MYSLGSTLKNRKADPEKLQYNRKIWEDGAGIF